MRHLLTPFITAATLALATAPAQATVCQAQPGQGAIDQYCEIIPSGAGDRPSGTTREQPALTGATQRELRQSGRDGAIVEALARTSPAPASSRPGASGGSPSGGSQPGGADGLPAPVPVPGANSPALIATSDVAAGESSSGLLDALLRDPFGGPIGSAWVVWAGLAVALITGTVAWRRRVRWS